MQNIHICVKPDKIIILFINHYKSNIVVLSLCQLFALFTVQVCALLFVCINVIHLIGNLIEYSIVIFIVSSVSVV